VIGEGACPYVRTGSFAAGARLVSAISELAGVEDHQPDADLRDAGVTVRLITITHDHCGLSERDVELPVRSRQWRPARCAADPSAVQTAQVTIDALVHPEVNAVLGAVLGYRDPRRQPEDLIDRGGRGLSLCSNSWTRHDRSRGSGWQWPACGCLRGPGGVRRVLHAGTPAPVGPRR